MNQEEYLAHHGVKGMHWGIRKVDSNGNLTKSGKKTLSKKMWDVSKKSTWTNRNKVGEKINSEINNSSEGKAYNALMAKRAIKVGNSISLSYLNEDWSDPEKVVDQMGKDTDVLAAYNAKEIEVGKKYIDTFSSALLKDLGLNDTSENHKYVNSLTKFS